jgi:dTDP-4-dehydrorhamnose reductase
MTVELWAGVEPTINRIGDTYLDQCRRSGHRERLEDLDRFAALGVKALRQPVLWETAAALRGGDPAGADLTFAEPALERIQQLGMRAVIGLVHHGSGPPHTGLLDDGFVEGLARYAGAVARAFPWVEEWTPVNEPLTTARFSCLYGHWHPHRCDEVSFCRALVNQCRATALAMRAIRRVIGGARLVQTEDMGHTYATPALQDQADFDNQRRWLGIDLLRGCVDRDHPFHEWLRIHGISERELAFFREQPTPPDILGLNYYVTRDRLLDERLERYPPAAHGGNGRQRYADVEAARVRPEGITGHLPLLRAAWQRQRVPLAFTEVHLGCTREEQLRWLAEAWEAVKAARAEEIDARAVTAWSLLGAYDWNSLVTRDRGDYEPGVFDLRGGAPRPTALARMATALATKGRFEHPLLGGRGWWRRPTRLLPGLPPSEASLGATERAAGERPPAGPESPLLVVGAAGTLGRAFGIVCEQREIACRRVTRRELDITDGEAVARMLDEVAPWAVVNAAGYVRVDDAERESDRCFRENVEGPEHLARACRAREIAFVTFSSDLVFDGGQRVPYAESDPPRPLNTYGRSKQQSEQRVFEANPGALVVRTSSFFGPWDTSNFLDHVLAALGRRESPWALDDVTVSPTYVPDLVSSCLDLLIDGEAGLWHLTNSGSVTWLALARQAAERAGFDAARVQGRSLSRAGLAAPRPPFTALRSEHGSHLPPLDDALERFLQQRRAVGGSPVL